MRRLTIGYFFIMVVKYLTKSNLRRKVCLGSESGVGGSESADDSGEDSATVAAHRNVSWLMKKQRLASFFSTFL